MLRSTAGNATKPKAQGYLRQGLPLSAVHASQESSARRKVGHKNQRGFLVENTSPISPVGQGLVPGQTGCGEPLPQATGWEGPGATERMLEVGG